MPCLALILALISPRRALFATPMSARTAGPRADATRAAALLNWFERLIRRRRESPEIGFGTLTLLDVDAPSVLAQALERYAARWFRVRRDGQRLPP